MEEPDDRLRARGVLIIEQGGRGGVADYTACLSAALVKRGIPVTIATADDHLFAPAPGVRIEPVFAYVRGNAAVTAWLRRKGFGKVLNGLRFLASIPRLALLARSSAVVHSMGWERTSIGIAATLAVRAARVPIVFTAHNTFERIRFSLDQSRVFPRLAEATIVHTEADRAVMGGDVSVIPHGHYGSIADTADPQDPAAARRELGLPEDGLVVLLFGVLRPDKGLGDLLEAAKASPQWHVLVAGEDDGALAAADDKLTELHGRVTVVEGFLPMDVVARSFAAADLVALPYVRASQSGVLHLAYGFGRAVVAYPVGGLTEAVLPGTTGWLTAAPTPAALAEALGDAAELDRIALHALGERARQWARVRFDWDEIATATEAVYVRALGR
jgi:glycosyltransferase involved in cell wall biosynthesis